MAFNWAMLTDEDRALAKSIIGYPEHWANDEVREPDLTVAPDGKPYLYRWHVIPRNRQANIYLHIQVASDPEPALHDHPWDNQSVILAGGYDEIWDAAPGIDQKFSITPLRGYREPRKGDVVHRKADVAHRLLLPEGIPYTISLFSTGPKHRKWGFWFPEGFRPFEDVAVLENNVSRYIKPGMA